MDESKYKSTKSEPIQPTVLSLRSEWRGGYASSSTLAAMALGSHKTNGIACVVEFAIGSFQWDRVCSRICKWCMRIHECTSTIDINNMAIIRHIWCSIFNQLCCLIVILFYVYTGSVVSLHSMVLVSSNFS